MSQIRQPNSDPIFRQILALRLQQLRADHAKVVGRKLSQADFASLLGIKKDRLGSYERGNREPPLQVLAVLKRVTGVTLDDLLAD